MPTDLPAGKSVAQNQHSTYTLVVTEIYSFMRKKIRKL